MNYVSKHLTKQELSCKCGCGFDNANPRLFSLFELIRNFEGRYPLTPTNVCRCKEYNEVVQKIANINYVAHSSTSKHITGDAMDIPSKNPKILFEFLDNLFPETYGLGLYSWGVHIDVRMNRARW